MFLGVGQEGCWVEVCILIVISVLNSSMQTRIWKRVQVLFWGLRTHPPPHCRPALLHGAEPVLRGVAAVPSPECGQSILATFHRKPDLRDRTGRKQVGCGAGNKEGWHWVEERGVRECLELGGTQTVIN